MNERQSLHDIKWFVGTLTDYGCQNTEYSVSLTDSDVQAFLEREEHQIRKEKAKVTYSVALVVAFLRLRTKTTNERFATDRFWPCI